MNKTILIAAGVLVVVALAAVWLRAAAPAVTPTIGAVAASPAYIVVNTATQVIVTAQITDLSLLPSSVNLLKVDANGKTLAVVGVMHDDGLNGDAVPRDQVFSFRLTANESVIGGTYYQVSAAFKGVLKRTLSTPIVVTVDPFKLPPDPGEAGKQTIAGVDSDGDGVRDDVQRYIGLSQQASSSIRAALTRVALLNQEFIIYSADRAKADTRDLATQRGVAIDCLSYVVGDPVSARTLWDDLKARILNTKARSLAFIWAEGQLSGTFFSLPDPSLRASRCSYTSGQQ